MEELAQPSHVDASNNAHIVDMMNKLGDQPDSQTAAQPTSQPASQPTSQPDAAFKQMLEQAVQAGKSGPTAIEQTVQKLGKARTDLTVRDICCALSKLDLCGHSADDEAWRDFADTAMARYRHLLLDANLADQVSGIGPFGAFDQLSELVTALRLYQTFGELSDLFDEAIGCTKRIFSKNASIVLPLTMVMEAVLNKVFAGLPWPAKPPTISQDKQALAASMDMCDLMIKASASEQEAMRQALLCLEKQSKQKQDAASTAGTDAASTSCV
jgi:hypothetical protein